MNGPPNDHRPKITGAPLSVDVVDVHAHLGPYSRFFIPDPDAATMIDVMNRTGTDVAVIASNLGIQADAHAGNTETLAAVEAHPDRIAAYAVINPWQRPTVEIDRVVDDPRFVGIKIHPSLHRYPVTGARYAAVWEFADATGCPVLSHTDADSAVDHPGLFASITARYPSAPIILGHAGISPAGVDASIAVVADSAHSYLEICGSQLTGALIGHMVRHVGSERVLFGSDFPFIDQRMSLGRVVHSGLDAAAQRAILGANSRRLFRWRPLPIPAGAPTPDGAPGRRTTPPRTSTQHPAETSERTR
ncbi:amidohydrolase family protein [Microlunatus soli]|uniref:Amidohydrolase-related domain-containing protein n=1 Tax=Microlunatus soli TaxID=630515 RepID=A0A1H1R7R6_9ACTN|nr:amidohydrolase family protein [Microlunatus soli]SDS31817.1 hypothetical protein SAMN04489812_1545 [Microlunatus soli]